MGSFIYNGFVSNLPIREGEEVVMFIGIENHAYNFYNDTCHMGLCGKGVTPVTLPIFGTANDYGFIETPVKDYNYEWLSKIVGNDIIDELWKVRDCIGDTIEDVQKDIKEKEEKGEKLDTCDKESIKTANRYIQFYKKLMNKEKMMFHDSYKDAVVYMVERRDVYDMFIEADSKYPYIYGFHEKEEADELKDMLTDTLKVMDEYFKVHSYNVQTPFSFESRDTIDRLEIEIECGIIKDQKDIDAARAVVEFAKILDKRSPLSHISLTFDERMKFMASYMWRKGDEIFDWWKSFDETLGWMHFNRTMADIYATYDKSTYGGQWPNFRKIIGLNKGYADLMRKSKKEYDERYS